MSEIQDATRVNPIHEGFLKLCRAGDAEKVETLLKSDASLKDCVEAGGFAGLHFAASYGHKSLMVCLLSHKATVDLQNFDHNTPLMLASRHGQQEMAEMLLAAGANINTVTETGVTALHHAARMGDLKMVKFLIAHGAKVDDKTKTRQGSPLHWAAHGGNLEVCAFLIYELGCNIDAVDEHNGTPLFQSVPEKKSEVIQFFLEHGANPMALAVHDTTPLHVAAEVGTLEDAKLLVEMGADPNAKDADGDTPLSLATAKAKKNFITAFSKPALSAEKRKEDAARFKAHGNKVFGDGENNKAKKFYSLAIALERDNHVYFSNRSACNFNTMQYLAGYLDALRCVSLAPEWPKGYLRLGSCLKAMKRVDEAKVACEKGLKLDANNHELKQLMAEIKTTMGMN